MRACKLWFVLAAACVIAGCRSLPVSLPEDVPERIELEDVPFFAQAQYQCGPAALATVLQSADATVTPDQLVPMVYLPGRKGSLQTELIAAARSFDRVPYPLPSDLASLLRELQAGRPVLVLQNLGFAYWPQWHFAVVVGFDRANDEVILRSGMQQRATSSVRRFMRSWDRAGRWAVVVLQPETLPAHPDPERYLTAAAGLEAVGRLNAAQAAYGTARAAWPGSAWPLLGLANVAYLRGEFAEAEALYREVVRRDPSNMSARYNLADTLVQRGCQRQARSELQAALATAADTAMRARLQTRLAELDAGAQADSHNAACSCSGAC